jgi:hypothetical protein
MFYAGFFMTRRSWLAFAGLFTFSVLTVLPMCGAMFQCGCTLWSIDRYCNIHHAGGPHCPWCVGGAKVMLPGYLVAMGMGLAIEQLSLKSARSVWVSLMFGAMGYVALLAASGWIVAKVMHYPMWFGLKI